MTIEMLLVVPKPIVTPDDVLPMKQVISIFATVPFFPLALLVIVKVLGRKTG